MKLRPAKNSDSQQIIQLIDAVYSEYNDTVCLDGAEKDLLDIEDAYRAVGGEFWVLIQDDMVVGTHGALPCESETAPDLKVCQFKRLYLAQTLRGTQWGHHLMQVTIDWARDVGFERVEFWSDTRFKRAHQFFTKFGFQRDGRSRDMDDGVEPYSEYFYFLDLQQKTGDRSPPVSKV